MTAPLFQVAAPALRDLTNLTRYLQEQASDDAARRVTDRLWRTFEEIASLPALGHHRRDIKDSSLLCYTERPYVIFFRRTPTVVILRVLHGARDMRRHV